MLKILTRYKSLDSGVPLLSLLMNYLNLYALQHPLTARGDHNILCGT